MIYIVDYIFVASQHEQVRRGGSIQEQLARKNIPNLNTQSRVGPEQFFLNGEKYRVKFIKPKDDKLIYTFEKINSKETLDKEFNSTLDADNFIAHLSGTLNDLNEYRNKIAQTLEST